MKKLFVSIFLWALAAHAQAATKLEINSAVCLPSFVLKDVLIKAAPNLRDKVYDRQAYWKVIHDSAIESGSLSRNDSNAAFANFANILKTNRDGALDLVAYCATGDLSKFQ